MMSFINFNLRHIFLRLLKKEAKMEIIHICSTHGQILVLVLIGKPEMKTGVLGRLITKRKRMEVCRVYQFG
jgi:hypothetical protein